MKYKPSTGSGRSAPLIDTHIYLTGFMGAGKTTVGQTLAQQLHCEFYDSDERIVEHSGQSIPDIFASAGEEGFRDIENEVVRELTGLPPGVIALGGGVVLREENRLLLNKTGTTCYLQWQPENLLERIFHDENRPLVSGHAVKRRRAELLALFESRRALYESADFIIVCEPDMTPVIIADKIHKALRSRNS
jgi:shikimate kinase